MTRNSKITVTIVFIIMLGLVINFIFYVKYHFNVRSETSLINQYYKLRDIYPEEAKHALERLLEKDPKNLTAIRELGYWYVRKGDINSALKQFSLAQMAYPNDVSITFELAKLLILTEKYDQAKSLLTKIASTNDLQLKQKIQAALAQIPTVAPQASPVVATGLYEHAVGNLKIVTGIPSSAAIPLSSGAASTFTRVSSIPLVETHSLPVAKPAKNSEHDVLFNQYYTLKKNQPDQAWKVLEKIIKRYPDDVNALKEAGYTTLNAKNNASAYSYFKRAYDITRDPQLAMQIGYILLDLDRKRLAYYYFDLATHTKDVKQRIDAEMAKTNLAAAQLKILPEPYYADIFYDPFYYSRFKMMVQPLVVKAGKLINEKYQFKVYLSYQRTVDDRSSFAQQLPQIFEDNVAITALGASINPIPSAPLTAFVEAGKAVDIVYQNRSRWRSDLRGGLAYYKEWGDKLTYAIEPVFSHKMIGDFYSDIIYFSRYRDIIGSVRLREGMRVFKNETSAIDLYLKGFVVWDTAHQYYNNIVEWGPGIALTPSNRYNIVFHLEALQGHYIPVTSPSPNPYPSNYHNNLLQLDCYVRL